MTDKFRYQDMFTTINIPNKQRRIALEAKTLLDVAHGLEPWDPNVHQHLSNVEDTADMFRISWEANDIESQMQDRLALTLVRRSLIIHLEHKNLVDRSDYSLKSLSIGNGLVRTHATNSVLRNSNNEGSTARPDLVAFTRSFMDTTAILGFSQRLRSLRQTQNESSSANFASAA